MTNRRDACDSVRIDQHGPVTKDRTSASSGARRAWQYLILLRRHDCSHVPLKLAFSNHPLIALKIAFDSVLQFSIPLGQ